MIMNKDALTLLHINIRSIISDSKQIQLKTLINKYNPDIISLNETFLKPNTTFEIEGYNIIRSDRLDRPGGGAALCIKSNIKHSEINTSKLNNNDNACGLSIKINNIVSTIFSIYSPPKEPLNSELFNHIILTHKHFIILGDLNAHNKLWHCKKENSYGRQLESLTNEHNIQIINNQTVTYPAGKSILDLTLLSKNLLTFPRKFKVLNDHISDHLPTLTVIKDIKLSREKISFQKTNWETFTRILSETHEPPNTPILTRAELDLAALHLTSCFNKAYDSSTTTITLANKPKSILAIPDALLKQIRLKRKIKRKLAKTHSAELRKILNMLCKKEKLKQPSAT
jgi:hypothetical protein